MKDRKVGFSLINVIIIMVVCSIVSGLAVGVIVTNGHNSALNYKNLSGDKDLKNFLDVYSNIVNKYYEEVDKTKMLDKAAEAMLSYLGDTYTTYMSDEEAKALEESLAGTYQGIGVRINNQEIVEVMKDSPAEKAGLKANDVILNINSSDVTGKSGAEIAALIRKNNDNDISVKVKRGEESMDFSVKVSTLAGGDVNYDLLDNNIGYLKLSIFSKTLDQQVAEALEYLENKGMEKLIIDLRDNTGGYLEIAENIASMFIEKGKLIYSLEDKNGKENYYDKTGGKKDYPIIILINRRSASASEILTGALKDSYGATIVGERSYGKGKVQQTSSLSDGSTAKYTTAKWLRPNGTCVDGVGINPDHEVSITYEKDEEGNISNIIDSQFEMALSLFGAM